MTKMYFSYLSGFCPVFLAHNSYNPVIRAMKISFGINEVTFGEPLGSLKKGGYWRGWLPSEPTMRLEAWNFQSLTAPHLWGTERGRD